MAGNARTPQSAFQARCRLWMLRSAQARTAWWGRFGTLRVTRRAAAGRYSTTREDKGMGETHPQDSDDTLAAFRRLVNMDAARLRREL